MWTVWPASARCPGPSRKFSAPCGDPRARNEEIALASFAGARRRGGRRSPCAWTSARDPTRHKWRGLLRHCAPRSLATATQSRAASTRLACGQGAPTGSCAAGGLSTLGLVTAAFHAEVAATAEASRCAGRASCCRAVDSAGAWRGNGRSGRASRELEKLEFRGRPPSRPRVRARQSLGCGPTRAVAEELVSFSRSASCSTWTWSTALLHPVWRRASTGRAARPGLARSRSAGGSDPDQGATSPERVTTMSRSDVARENAFDPSQRPAI